MKGSSPQRRKVGRQKKQLKDSTLAMVINEKDLRILIALQENPLAPASEIAKAVKLSTPTVISRLKMLRKNKDYYSVIADLKPSALELEIVDVLLEINRLKDIEFVEQRICYNHPFTLFRIRCLGKFNGLYLQFRIPNQTRTLLLELFESLKAEGQIQNYFLPQTLPNTSTIYTRANLANWEQKLMHWKFDWEDWFAKVLKTTSKKILEENSPSILERIDELDIALLAELTMNARRKNIDLMDALKLNKKAIGFPQKISRKLAFIKQRAIAQYRVFLRWEPFEIYNSFLAIGECDGGTCYKLQNLLKEEPIPFESTYKVTASGFLWYIRCPAPHFSNLSEFLWKVSKKVDFYFLDYKKAEFYGLWKEAFDTHTHQWKTELMEKRNILK